MSRKKLRGWKVSFAANGESHVFDLADMGRPEPVGERWIDTEILVSGEGYSPALNVMMDATWRRYDAILISEDGKNTPLPGCWAISQVERCADQFVATFSWCWKDAPGRVLG